MVEHSKLGSDLAHKMRGTSFNNVRLNTHGVGDWGAGDNKQNVGAFIVLRKSHQRLHRSVKSTHNAKVKHNKRSQNKTTTNSRSIVVPFEASRNRLFLPRLAFFHICMLVNSMLVYICLSPDCHSFKSTLTRLCHLCDSVARSAPPARLIRHFLLARSAMVPEGC